MIDLSYIRVKKLSVNFLTLAIEQLKKKLDTGKA